MAKATLTIYGRVNDGPPYALTTVEIRGMRANARPLVAELFRQLAAATEEGASDNEATP